MKPSVERSKKYRLALISGILAAILTYFILQALNPLLAQYGILNSWSSIKGPLSRAAGILGIHGGGWSMKYDVWIETQAGQTFSTSVCSDDQNCDPPQWTLRSKETASPSRFFTVTRGADCKNLGEFPLNPNSQIVECVYAVDTSIDLVPQVYFALMADGSIKYFVINFYNYFRIQGKLFLTGLLLYLIVLFLIFLVMNSAAQQIEMKKKMPLAR